MATVGVVLGGVFIAAVVAYVFRFEAAAADLVFLARTRSLLHKLPHVILQLVRSC